MKYLELIPSLIKKFVGYTCSVFLLGWGGYDYFENRLNANNDKLKSEIKIERQLELSPLHTDIAVIRNDVGWIKSYLENKRN